MRAAVLPTLSLLTVLQTQSVAAQQPVLHVDRFTVEDGLRQNWVDAVAQDSVGFIWVGSARGLQRFDGYAFIAYEELDPDAPPELGGPIQELHVDPHGNLWIATERALFRAELRSQRLTRVALERPFRSWSAGPAGELWVLDSAAVLRVDVSGSSPRTAVAADDPQVQGCLQLTVTRGGELWLGCTANIGSTLVRLNLAARERREYPLPGLERVTAILEDSLGRILVGGGNRLQVIDPPTGRSHTLAGFSMLSVRGLLRAGSGGVLVVSETEVHGAIMLLDGAANVVQTWQMPQEVKFVSDVALDREGGVWMTTSTAGLFRADVSPGFMHMSTASRVPLPLASDFVTALHECRDGELWLGTLGGGAYRLSADWKTAIAYRHRAGARDALASDQVWDVQEDDDGTHWISTISGICLVSASGLKCHRPPVGEHGGTQIVRDSEGWLWLARTTRGIISFDPRSSVFGEDQGLAHAMSLYVDPATHDLWIGSDRLLRARVSNGKIVGPPDTVAAVVSARNPIYQIHRDGQGLLWLASVAGLQRWDESRNGFAVVDLRELRGATVFSIEEDVQGRFWLGTGNGLVLYSPATGFARRFRRQDGVLNTEFNRRAARLLRTGEMVFGGTHGLTVFRPEQVTAARRSPNVEFTGWSAVTSQGRSGGSTHGMPQLRLRTADRSITFEFTALTFAPGPSRRYRYRLEGLDEGWMETSDRAVTFGALPAGNYVLHVQASTGAENLWDEAAAQLPVVMVPPFWRTTWFTTFVVVLILAGIWVLHRLRLRQALATERLRVRISRDLHDDIGAGLSSIALLSDGVGTNGGMGERERSQLLRIGQSARQMVDDLRDIVWAIDPEADRWRNVVSRMRDVADDLLPGARVTFHAPELEELSARIAMAERRDLFLLYKELLHNVARHSGAASVEISLAAHRDRIELTITDDGRGFDAAVSRGGMGLRSMQERAARLGGRIEFTSGKGDSGGGTTARLVLGRT